MLQERRVLLQEEGPSAGQAAAPLAGECRRLLSWLHCQLGSENTVNPGTHLFPSATLITSAITTDPKRRKTHTHLTKLRILGPPPSQHPLPLRALRR